MALLLGSLCILSLLSIAVAYCPMGFAILGSKCYYVSKNAVTWQEAERICRSKDSQMLVFNDDQERMLVRNYLKTLAIPLQCWYSGVWTAINELDKKEFLVHPLNTSIPYPIWAPGQPDKPEQQCVSTCELTTDGMIYHDYECDAKYSVVCQTDSIYRVGPPKNSMQMAGQLCFQLNNFFYCTMMQQSCQGGNC
ncbi:lithostathine-1-like [Scaptodrosophila lebanonensis]|uniref:Lithostathine-1-like n=1 Tax=Drosophila lebanonensis TaxID=7225 RepID=A0A6J2U988_DROLE|nr:lithostathine-1-like [Scaptodrosophila lebanonensis]